jgi:hypothetical protein
MILLELKPNEVFQLAGDDRFLYSVFNPNDNGTIRVRKIAFRSKDRRIFMLSELELSNFGTFTEVEHV